MASSTAFCAMLILLAAAVLCVGAAGASNYPPHTKQTDSELILPPWVDAYGAPSATVRVYYHGTKLKTGQQYGVNFTQATPHVTFKGSAVLDDHYYTLVTVDPDAPSYTNMTRKCVLHWLVINIPGSIKSSQEVYEEGDEVQFYGGPRPTIGVHRYIFLLFDQGRNKFEYQAPTQRLNFSVRGLVTAGQLGYPVGGTLFRAEAGKF